MFRTPLSPATSPPVNPTPRFHVHAAQLKQDCRTRRRTLQLNPCSAGVAVVVGYSVHVRAGHCIPQHNICLMVERLCELSHAFSCYEGCDCWQNELIGRNVEDLHLPGSLQIAVQDPSENVLKTCRIIVLSAAIAQSVRQQSYY